MKPFLTIFNLFAFISLHLLWNLGFHLVVNCPFSDKLVFLFHGRCCLHIFDKSFAKIVQTFIDFFKCYLAASRPTLNHYRGGSLTHPMLITCVLHIRPEGHQEPRSEVRSLSPAKRLVRFEPRTFRFWSQRLRIESLF